MQLFAVMCIVHVIRLLQLSGDLFFCRTNSLYSKVVVSFCTTVIRMSLRMRILLYNSEHVFVDCENVVGKVGQKKKKIYIYTFIERVIQEFGGLHVKCFFRRFRNLQNVVENNCVISSALSIYLKSKHNLFHRCILTFNKIYCNSLCMLNQYVWTNPIFNTKYIYTHAPTAHDYFL